MELYEKIASTRWQRELGTMDPERLIARRNELWAHAPDLTPDQLDRHRRLRAKQVEQISRIEGIQPGTSLMSQVAGPHMVGDQVQLPADSGHFLRNAQAQLALQKSAPKPSLQDLLTTKGRNEYVEKLREHAASVLGGIPKGPHPEDPTVQHATMMHELGERASARASKQGIGARYVASHLGETPDIVERHSTFRDPAAGKLFDELRQHDPGDAFIQAKMRQFGHTPNNPLPLGGRQHRAVAKAVLEDAPLNRVALQNRITAGVAPLREATAPLRRSQSSLTNNIVPEVYNVALPRRVQQGLAKVEQAASTVGRGLQKVPFGGGLYEKFRPIVKNLLHSGHAPAGGHTDFLRHLSTVR